MIDRIWKRDSLTVPPIFKKTKTNLNDYDKMTTTTRKTNKKTFPTLPYFYLPSPGFGLNGTCMETLLGKDKDGEEDKCSEKSNSGIGSGNGQMKKWFTDTFFARRKEEEDGGESTDDYENSNNRNLNNSSDNGDSTASKGTLDTALVHSVIEEETSSYASSSDQQ